MAPGSGDGAVLPHWQGAGNGGPGDLQPGAAKRGGRGLQGANAPAPLPHSGGGGGLPPPGGAPRALRRGAGPPARGPGGAHRPPGRGARGGRLAGGGGGRHGSTSGRGG